MGLGVIGRGKLEAGFLAQHGADLIVTDQKNANELQPSLDYLAKYPNIHYTLGEHKTEDFQNRDLIIKSANTPLNSPYIAAARESGTQITTTSAILVKNFAGMTIGITGTRGKTTTTTLIYEILKSAGQSAFLAGNIRGSANLPFLEDASKDSFAVLELDSWQLQGFAEEKVSPHIAVFTNFMEDHLNYYQGDMDLYFQDKANIFKYQNDNDFLITTNAAWIEIQKRFEGEIKSKVIIVDKLALNENPKLIGEHNLVNIALALKTAEILKIDSEIALKTALDFTGVPGRLEYKGEKNGIKFYNDTTSTTPQALKAALHSVSAGKNILLICGGADKNLNYGGIGDLIQQKVKFAAVFNGTALEKFKAMLNGVEYTVCQDMPSAFHEVMQRAKTGDIVLLSPASASFGIFKNEYDRGLQFDETVTSLI